MSKTVITDTNAFENEINSFEKSFNKIRNIFQSEKNNIKKIDGTSKTWSGLTQETMYNKQLMFQKNFEPIEEALQIYINFMKKTLEDYKRFEQTTNASIENGLENLNVN